MLLSFRTKSDLADIDWTALFYMRFQWACGMSGIGELTGRDVRLASAELGRG